MDTSKVKVGDRITFHAICRWKTRKSTRLVTAIDSLDGQIYPTVRYEGCASFTVRPEEITEHHPAL